MLNLQQSSDQVNWGIDGDAINRAFREEGIRLVQHPIRDFDPRDLRHRLPGENSTDNSAYLHSLSSYFCSCFAPKCGFDLRDSTPSETSTCGTCATAYPVILCILDSGYVISLCYLEPGVEVRS